MGSNLAISLLLSIGKKKKDSAQLKNGNGKTKHSEWRQEDWDENWAQTIEILGNIELAYNKKDTKNLEYKVFTNKFINC